MRLLTDLNTTVTLNKQLAFQLSEALKFNLLITVLLAP